MDCKKDSKQLISVGNSITTNNSLNPMPENKSNEEIANDFADFFIEKKNKINERSVYQCRRIQSKNQ